MPGARGSRRQLRTEPVPGSGPGQSLTELALTMPLLILLLVGIIATAWMGFCYVSVTNGARQGARYMLNYPAPPHGRLDGQSGTIQEEIEDVVKRAMPALDSDQVQVIVSPAEELRRADTLISVQVVYTLDLPTITLPYGVAEGGVTLMQPVQLQATSRMRTD
jgi:Flp pilus assembly protein TadG